MCKQPLLHNFLWLSPVESSLVMFKLSIWRLFLQPSESTAAQQQQYDGTTHLVFTWRDLLEKKDLCIIFKYTEELIEIIIAAILKSDFEIKIQMSWPDNKNSSIHSWF